jgi:hypothetical protein
VPEPAEPNPFDFETPVAKPARAEPAARRFRRWKPLALATALSAFAMALVVRSAYRGHLDRAHRGPVVGKWVYDGPPFKRLLPSDGPAEAFITVFTFGAAPILHNASEEEHHKPGWALELRDDGRLFDVGRDVGRWRATGGENKKVQVSTARGTFGGDDWEFAVGPNGKALWYRGPNKYGEMTAPVPLRRAP